MLNLQPADNSIAPPVCRDRQEHSRQALVESVDMFGAFLCNGIQ